MSVVGLSLGKLCKWVTKAAVCSLKMYHIVQQVCRILMSGLSIFTSYHTRHVPVRTGQKARCSELSPLIKSNDAGIICAIEQPS